MKQAVVLFSSLAVLTCVACGGQVATEDTVPRADAAPPRDGRGSPDARTGNDSGTTPSDASASDASTSDARSDEATTVRRAYRPSTAIFPNPERGFYRYVEITSENDFSQVRAGGYTLAYSYVRLDSVRDRAITNSILNAMERGLNAARKAGIKVILRFAYNEGPYPDSEPDASKTWILAHIEQVKPYLQRHADVIALVQAGFIGAWGEWHTSTNGLLRDARDRRDILTALLAALPKERMTQLRYPPHKHEIYGDELTTEQAFSGSDEARVGHHNDCFLASETDMGTYPDGEAERWKSYLAKDALYVPMGGETCAVSSRSGCSTALAEMERLHFTYINQDYHQSVVSGWSTQGCRGEMDKRLGYRLRLIEADIPERARPGQAFTFHALIANDGWASPFNPRPIFLVLDGPRRVEVPLSVDPRRLAPGSDSQAHERVQLPLDLPPGSYRIALWLPDAAEGLRSRTEYSVRLANEDVHDAATGLNVLGQVAIQE